MFAYLFGTVCVTAVAQLSSLRSRLRPLEAIALTSFFPQGRRQSGLLVRRGGGLVQARDVIFDSPARLP